MKELALRLVDVSSNAFPPDSLSDAVRVVHALPGRVRYHLPSWDGSRASDLEAAVLCTPGVVDVEASPITRNVLVYFDREESGEAEIRRAMNRLASGAPRVNDDSGARDRRKAGSTLARTSSQCGASGVDRSRKRLAILLGPCAATLLPHVPTLLMLTFSLFTTRTPAGLTLLSLDWLELLTRVNAEPA